MVLKRLKIKTKLLWLMIGLSLVPLSAIGLISLNASREALSDQAFAQLTSVRDSKRAQLERYFAKVNSDIKVLAGSSHIIDALDAFASALSDGKIDTSQYDYFESLEYGDAFGSFGREYGYYDLMLVTREGDVVYSLRQESDLADNVTRGSPKDSGLGRSFHRALGDIVITDFAPYEPADNQPIAFAMSPIVQFENTEGIVVLKLNTDRIAEIMGERSGMGETGESYLVGPDNLMRSDSYLSPESHSVAASFADPEGGRVDTTASRAALSGKTGHDILSDYRGVSVLSAFAPVRFHTTIYALIAEIDAEEAFQPVSRLRNIMIGGALLVLVVLLILSYVLAKRLTEPLIQLAASSIEIAEGKLDSPIDTTGEDELAVLARSFRQMRDSIREKIEDLDAEIGERRRAEEALQSASERLEERVRERTTELESANERITAEHERLQGILDTSPVGVAFSSGGLLRFVNPRFRETFGLEVGDPAVDLYVDSDERKRIFSTVEMEGKVENHETQMYDRKRQVRDILINYRPMSLGDEEGTLGWLMDITESKKAENEIKERLDELSRFRRMAVGRESKMIELKKEINALMKDSGRTERYRIH